MSRKRKRLVGNNTPATDLITADPAVSKAPLLEATGTTSQVMPLGSMTRPPVRGTRELLQLFADSPWLRAIVSKIGRAVAEIDWVLYAKAAPAQSGFVKSTELFRNNGDLHERAFQRTLETGKLKEIKDHPLLDFLAAGTGNPRLLGFAALEVTQNHLDLTGEAFWLLEKDGLGVPRNFWPLPPHWIKDFPSERNPYWMLSIPNGVQLSIPTTEIVPFIQPNPHDPYGRGTGIANALADEIQIDEYAAKHQKSFFLNRARPDIIVSGQYITPKDAERLERQWLSEHQGFWKSFKPLFFSQKIDVKELTQTFESMQMVQIRKHERDTFVSVFGAPPEKFGIIGESKRSTIAAADYFWNKDLIKPRVELIRRVLQHTVVPLYDDRIILYYDTPVIQDDEFKMGAMKNASWASTINEWRAAQGQPPIGSAGDVLAVPVNYQLIPIKDEAGNFLSAQEMYENTLPKKEATNTDNAVDAKAIASQISDEILEEFRGLLSPQLLER